MLDTILNALMGAIVVLLLVRILWRAWVNLVDTVRLWEDR